MKPKTIKILYWIFAGIFLLFMLMDGIGGVVQQKDGQDVMRHLGYPLYAMIIFGIAKLAGVVAIAQTKYTAIKEWAFAGFVINFISAFASRAFAGDSFGLLVPPIIALAYTLVLYALWKKYEQVKAA